MPTLDQLTQRATEDLHHKMQDGPKTTDELKALVQQISKNHTPQYYHTALRIAREHEIIGTRVPKKEGKGKKIPIRMILWNIEEYISDELVEVLREY